MLQDLTNLQDRSTRDKRHVVPHPQDPSKLAYRKDVDLATQVINHLEEISCNGDESDLSEEDFIIKKKRPKISKNNFSQISSSEILNQTEDNFKRKTPNCRKSQSEIDEFVHDIEEKNRGETFIKYREFLPSLFDYVIFTFEEKDGSVNEWKAVLRLNINTKEEAEMWLEEYQAMSNCDFRIRDGKKENTDRLVWKKMYRCHHNIPKVNVSDSQESRVQKKVKRLSKNTDCESNMIITIKQKNMKWSSDALLKKYPCEILINHRHNHPILAREALRRRRPSKAIEEKFRKLFNSGHSPSSAVESHKFDLQNEHGCQYIVVSADRSKCPDVKWASRLYYKIFKNVYGVQSGDDMVSSLEEFIARYNESQGSVCAACRTLGNRDLIVALCTPMMKRAHERLRSAGETLFVDSSGTMDVYNSRVFLLTCPSIAGGIPIGILILSSEAECVLKEGLDLWLSLLPEEAFGGRGKSIGPKIIMTDDSTPERNALASIFPFAVLLLCMFHILQAFWRYVWSNEHKVDKKDRSDVYFMFRDTVYCPDADTFETLYKELLELPAVASNPILKKHLLQLKARSKEWSLHARADLLTRGHLTNNLSEAGMKLLKEKGCQRVKAFSPVQLFDFYVTRYSAYLERRIVDFVNNRSSNIQRSRYFIEPEKMTPLTTRALERPDTYEVKNVSKGTEYIVNMVDEICSCPIGRNGSPCKHQCAVVRDFNVPSTQILNFSHCDDPTAKETLAYIVYGQTLKLPDEWFASLIPTKVPAQERASILAAEDSRHEDSNPVDDMVVLETNTEVQACSLPEGSSEGPSAVDIDLISENLQKMVDGWKSLLQSRPDVFAKACEAIVKQNNNMSRSDAALASAMHMFGKDAPRTAINHSVVPSPKPTYLAATTQNLLRPAMTSATNHPIHVNSHAVARRSAYLEGGKNTTITGRPPNAMRRNINEHNFSAPGPKQSRAAFWDRPPLKGRGPAPHSLNTCVDRNIALGKTHSKR